MIRTLPVVFLFVFSFSVMAQEENPVSETTALSVESQKHYVIDDLFVYMHAGPGRDYRIVGSITAGTMVDTLQVDTDAEYTEVEDDRGRTGWVETRFITDQVSLRQQIPLLQQQLTQQNDLLTSRESDIARMEQEISSVQATEARLRQQLNDLQVENTEISAQLQQDSSAEQLDWFMKGGGVAFAGVILGLIISLVFKGRKRDQWM